MLNAVRQEWGDTVYRLFPDYASAQRNADILNRHGNRNFVPAEHESKNGFLVKCSVFGEVFDAAGMVC